MSVTNHPDAAWSPDGGSGSASPSSSPAFESVAGGKSQHNPPGTGSLGMLLFLASLAVLFAASIAAHLIIRARAEQWPPENLPKLPSTAWVSTILIVFIGIAIQLALNYARHYNYGKLFAFLLIAFMLNVTFLLSQAVNWAWLISIGATAGKSLYLWSFYFLTGLHALHVIGGLFLLGFVIVRAFRGAYSADYHPGVRYATMYSHFLGIVWIVLFVCLFLI